MCIFADGWDCYAIFRLIIDYPTSKPAMPRHRNRAKTKKRRKQGLRPVCTALAVCLVWTVPGLARHNRVTVTTYGDAAGTAARAAVTETFFDGLGRQTMPVARGAGGSGSVRTILDDDGTIHPVAFDSDSDEWVCARSWMTMGRYGSARCTTLPGYPCSCSERSV